MIQISNHGPLIAESNYWQSDYAGSGYAFVSPNAGVIRLLLPPALSIDIKDMRLAKHVVISIGKSEQYKREMSEFLFDDASDYPYVQFIDLQQWQHLPAQSDFEDPRCELTAWENRRGKPHKVLSRPCWLRRADIPCLKAWGSDG